MRDHDLLISAVDAYCDALHRTDVGLLDAVFDPAASLFDVDGGALRVDPYARWRQEVDARPDPASAGREPWSEILAINWLSADAASVALRIQIFDDIFVDHLSLVRTGGRFRVVAKVWHLERSPDRQAPG